MEKTPKPKRTKARTRSGGSVHVAEQPRAAAKAHVTEGASAAIRQAKSDEGADAAPEPWSPHAPGVWIERDARTGQAISIAHPGQPWIAGDANAISDRELRDIATGYILAVNDVLQLPDAWLVDLARKDQPGPPGFQLRWKPIEQDPRGSFRCTRRGARRKVLDETAVMLACLAVPGKRGLVFLNGGQGLRVTMHVDRAVKGRPHRVRVTSVTSSLPPWTERDVVRAWQAGLEAAARYSDLHPLLLAPSFDPLLAALNKLFRSVFGMPDSTMFKDFGLRFVAPPGTDVPRPDHFDLLAKSAPPVSDLESLSYKVVLGLRMGMTIDATAREMVPLVTHAAPAPLAKVFLVDPMTKGGLRARAKVQPHRPAANLDGSRVLIPLVGVTPGSSAGRYLLADGKHVDVVKSFIGGDANPVDQSLEFDSTIAFSSRSNTQAAVNTYAHFKLLVLRLQYYGFAPDEYLAFADLPLKVKYRGGIVPGARGGNTINAQVRWRIRPDDSATGIGTLETSLALADLRLSPRRSPLGIACDPRWLWHEFGHVLLAGATGDLEFRFAHSAGDAMAAILHDPESELAGVPAWRGITFPWVALPDRHHDRRPQDGWSWSGTFNGRERDFATNVSDRRGYWTEQLLSSSLFRLYRTLGGDALTVDVNGHVIVDKAMRRAAAEHALFLIIKAIRLVGPAAVTPAMTPENLATALLDADIGSSTVPAAAATVPIRGWAAWRRRSFAGHSNSRGPIRTRRSPFPATGQAFPPPSTSSSTAVPTRRAAAAMSRSTSWTMPGTPA